MTMDASNCLCGNFSTRRVMNESECCQTTFGLLVYFYFHQAMSKIGDRSREKRVRHIQTVQTVLGDKELVVIEPKNKVVSCGRGKDWST
jgi:hypothetical protein